MILLIWNVLPRKEVKKMRRVIRMSDDGDSGDDGEPTSDDYGDESSP